MSALVGLLLLLLPKSLGFSLTILSFKKFKLIWKNGSRMKVFNGTTSGPVTEVAVKDVTKRIVS